MFADFSTQPTFHHINCTLLPLGQKEAALLCQHSGGFTLSDSDDKVEQSISKNILSFSLNLCKALVEKVNVSVH